MNTYKVSLTRVYFVDVEAESEESAKDKAEFYLGHSEDISRPIDREKEHFKIGEMEMMMNEATEIIKEEE